MALVLHSDVFWISPYVFTAFVALREKGLEFRVNDVKLQDKEQQRSEYVKGSITGKVPALEHDGWWLAESSAIVEYLEETFAPPAHARLFPEPVRDRARARMLMAWLRSDILPLKEQRPTTTMFYGRATTPMDAKCKEAADKLVRVVEQSLPHGAKNLFGEWSIADADVAFHLHRLVKNGEDMPSRIRDYAIAQFERPSIKEFVDHPRAPYVPYD